MVERTRKVLEKDRQATDGWKGEAWEKCWACQSWNSILSLLSLLRRHSLASTVGGQHQLTIDDNRCVSSANSNKLICAEAWQIVEWLPKMRLTRANLWLHFALQSLQKFIRFALIGISWSDVLEMLENRRKNLPRVGLCRSTADLMIRPFWDCFQGSTGREKFAQSRLVKAASRFKVSWTMKQHAMKIAFDTLKNFEKLWKTRPKLALLKK